jgi:hypothetical protein
MCPATKATPPPNTLSHTTSPANCTGRERGAVHEPLPGLLGLPQENRKVCDLASLFAASPTRADKRGVCAAMRVPPMSRFRSLGPDFATASFAPARSSSNASPGPAKKTPRCPPATAAPPARSLSIANAARTRHDSAGPQSPRSRPHPESGPAPSPTSKAPTRSSPNIAEAIQYGRLDRTLLGMKLVHSVLGLIWGGAALQRCANRRRMSGFGRCGEPLKRFPSATHYPMMTESRTRTPASRSRILAGEQQ